jgi:hypothetical protein
VGSAKRVTLVDGAGVNGAARGTGTGASGGIGTTLVQAGSMGPHEAWEEACAEASKPRVARAMAREAPRVEE